MTTMLLLILIAPSLLSAFVLPTVPVHAACLLQRRYERCLFPPVAAADGTIQEQLKARMKAAMKAKAKQELSAVRLMIAALTTKEKETGVEGLDDAAAVDALSKLAKMRKESIEMFEKGGNADAAEAEKFELALLEEYLPAMADEATVRGWIAEAIAEACPDGPDKKLMGKVMGALMKKHKGEFDGKAANKWVGEMLAA